MYAKLVPIAHEKEGRNKLQTPSHIEITFIENKRAI